VSVFIPDKWARTNAGAVPILRSDEEANSLQATTALFLCGHIAVAKYSLLSSRLVRSILRMAHIQPRPVRFPT
jgi:hypothetical protein